MLDYSVSHYLGSYWRTTPLYVEKIVPLLDYCLSNNYTFNTKMSQAFYELIDKYQNTANLPVENMKAFITEQGYGYIADLFEDRPSNLKLVIYLLALIHELKGTEAGVRLVLQLFQLDTEPSDTKLVQWFEETPVAEENTFTMSTKLDVSKAGSSFFEHFGNFIKNYVYPELKALNVRYSMTAKRQHVPVTRVNVKYTAYGLLDSPPERLTVGKIGALTVDEVNKLSIYTLIGGI